MAIAERAVGKRDRLVFGFDLGGEAAQERIETERVDERGIARWHRSGRSGLTTQCNQPLPVHHVKAGSRLPTLRQRQGGTGGRHVAAFEPLPQPDLLAGDEFGLLARRCSLALRAQGVVYLAGKAQQRRVGTDQEIDRRDGVEAAALNGLRRRLGRCEGSKREGEQCQREYNACPARTIPTTETRSPLRWPACALEHADLVLIPRFSACPLESVALRGKRNADDRVYS